MPHEGEPLPMWGLGPEVDGTKELPLELQIMTQSLLNAALHRGRIRHLRDIYEPRIPKPEPPARDFVPLDT